LIEKPEMTPALDAVSIILVRTSITSTNRRGDKGSPWCNPLEAKKKYVGDPLIRIAKDVEEMQ